MSKTKIFTIFVIIDLAIMSACVWAAFHRIPARQFLLPAGVLFVLNGLWLVWMTVTNTPRT
ncbi:MAG TPA: hypothetical protein VI636_01845 [Candidatus Angelobacter sp.]